MTNYGKQTVKRKRKEQNIIKCTTWNVRGIAHKEEDVVGALNEKQIKIIETSGRLHPSWPQNKRLYKPWTKDYRHTGQDRWIQTELAFTLAKNATKPNPVEIIPLKTTRKENNWKAEKTLARTVVTLEAERIKLAQSLMFMMMMMTN